MAWKDMAIPSELETEAFPGRTRFAEEESTLPRHSRLLLDLKTRSPRGSAQPQPVCGWGVGEEGPGRAAVPREQEHLLSQTGTTLSISALSCQE